MQFGKLTATERDAGRPGSTGRRHASEIALAALCTLLFLTFLDNTIVSVGLGAIQSDLQAGVTQLQWVVGAYALTFASLMLACGMIGDELGRKKVMLTGAGVFCAGSVVCALAPNSGTLIAGRAIMGLGAAASEPGTLSVLRHVYPSDRDRARAVGIWAAVSGLALALGPVIGGALVGAWSWRGIFWFNLAFGLAALIIAAIVVPESADPHAVRVDTAGTLLGTGALAALVFGIINAETSSFGATVPVILFCVAAACAVAFGWWERRAAHPLLDLRFFRLPMFSVPNVIALFSYFATFAIFFFTALYLNEVVGASGYRIALVFAPMTVLMILASVFTGYWTGAAGPRWPITIGCTLFGVGLLLVNSLIKQHPDDTALAVALALAGIGIGITVVPITTAVLGAVPPDRSGMAASAANTSREIGAVTGVSILGALVFAQLSAQLPAKIEHLPISAADKAGIRPFIPLIIHVIETGQSGLASKYSSFGSIVTDVLNAAYAAFGDGLHAALYLAAALVFLSAALGAVTLRGKPTPDMPNAHSGSL
ncbi:MAG: MFS transporter [Nocardiopsaceae bacterium]|nr:MFS transporter [Nocardiopsaceae bacterium]